ncbi:hypothetical protein Ae168Ps1_3264 [Pseudonocardia sp. Ae168_Ps1]|uniref:hypothetical protein n=1 Tax=unclassified Pseudonocardia TaxID=2619320 RepID=UPI0006CB55E8|nr:MULTISPECIES: hypothetical protein [unclassified Pseudonocardia]ALE75650.1 hypothetical protein FRP1_27215 [Pseudonocardia sp. EC080625-04]ALL75026.1 hypothetical protein AD006_06395 [Pseudonocardia sp. EC080610-09]ALL82047.1 hypothetical protein AD017_14210 [Pseudonocardia sp. EC080619-01]OLL74866.1 hypothetical protein Ae150APs1_3244 [Pseudonocardia sp. Ae150A_Ps1]OLL80858.1 hypothetical protein Ae168Ps1_3264 [Pseudonocardia sp. Ae168_Ps1]
MTGPQNPHRDDAARRVGEALQAQARGRPMPPPRPGGPPPAPPRVPGRVPPPAPRPAPQVHHRPAPVAAAPRATAAPAGSPVPQILWAALITLLVGALLGGGIALVSVLLPGALPALG